MNTENLNPNPVAAQPEPMMTVAQASNQLTCGALPLGTLMKLGKECTMTAKAMNRPTGSVPVYGKRWTSEKTYTFDVLREVFRLNPATRDYVPTVAP